LCETRLLYSIRNRFNFSEEQLTGNNLADFIKIAEEFSGVDLENKLSLYISFDMHTEIIVQLSTSLTPVSIFLPTGSNLEYLIEAIKRKFSISETNSLSLFDVANDQLIIDQSFLSNIDKKREALGILLRVDVLFPDQTQSTSTINEANEMSLISADIAIKRICVISPNAEKKVLIEIPVTNGKSLSIAVLEKHVREQFDITSFSLNFAVVKSPHEVLTDDSFAALSDEDLLLGITICLDSETDKDSSISPISDLQMKMNENPGKAQILNSPCEEHELKKLKSEVFKKTVFVMPPGKSRGKVTRCSIQCVIF